MTYATVQISRYISVRGIVVAENAESGLVTVRDGNRLHTGSPIATQIRACGRLDG